MLDDRPSLRINVLTVKIRALSRLQELELDAVKVRNAHFPAEPALGAALGPAGERGRGHHEGTQSLCFKFCRGFRHVRHHDAGLVHLEGNAGFFSERRGNLLHPRVETMTRDHI